MRPVIADTGPINYLILIGHIGLLSRLFDRVALPAAVPLAGGIHRGEATAIALALAMQADLLLIDDRRGVRAAKQHGIRVTGTLGLLDLAAERGFVDFSAAIRRLEATSFRRPEALRRKAKPPRRAPNRDRMG